MFASVRKEYDTHPAKCAKKRHKWNKGFIQKAVSVCRIFGVNVLIKYEDNERVWVYSSHTGWIEKYKASKLGPSSNTKTDEWALVKNGVN